MAANLLTVDEVAAKLNCSIACVYSLVSAGRLACHRIGLRRGTIRVSEAQLQDFLTQTKQERKQEEDVKLQKSEEAKQAAKAQELLQEQREKRIQEENRHAQAAAEEHAARSSAERIDGYTHLNNKTFDINRHLVNIGAVGGATIKGSFLNQRA